MKLSDFERQPHGRFIVARGLNFHVRGKYQGETTVVCYADTEDQAELVANALETVAAIEDMFVPLAGEPG